MRLAQKRDSLDSEIGHSLLSARWPLREHFELVGCLRLPLVRIKYRADLLVEQHDQEQAGDEVGG